MSVSKWFDDILATKGILRNMQKIIRKKGSGSLVGGRGVSVGQHPSYPTPLGLTPGGERGATPFLPRPSSSYPRG